MLVWRSSCCQHLAEAQLLKLHMQESQAAVERRIMETPELAELQVRRLPSFCWAFFVHALGCSGTGKVVAVAT